MKQLQPTLRFLFVCAQDHDHAPCPGCGGNGRALLVALREAIDRIGLWERVAAVPCGCIGCGDEGPIVYDAASGSVFTGVAPPDITPLLEHVIALDVEKV